jgi:hypothetical protein
MNSSTAPFIIDSIAVSLGFLEGFSMMVMARIFADGAGDRRACMRASSDAKVRAWVNGTGFRSLIERLVRIVGSRWYVRRICVRFGSNLGINGGILLSCRLAASPTCR